MLESLHHLRFHVVKCNLTHYYDSRTKHMYTKHMYNTHLRNIYLESIFRLLLNIIAYDLFYFDGQLFLFSFPLCYVWLIKRYLAHFLLLNRFLLSSSLPSVCIDSAMYKCMFVCMYVCVRIRGIKVHAFGL